MEGDGSLRGWLWWRVWAAEARVPSCNWQSNVLYFMIVLSVVRRVLAIFTEENMVSQAVGSHVC